ncbi:hypothetical protein [Antrihabitans stalactiti]|uniref:hypothetical protein n=1 Tax=Antrihabitans stalactiti TaxID=2584121 RepID=UPI00146E1CCF|nr:hypothetical protein [Antrihabitans stalactiti]
MNAALTLTTVVAQSPKFTMPVRTPIPLEQRDRDSVAQEWGFAADAWDYQL